MGNQRLGRRGSTTSIHPYINGDERWLPSSNLDSEIRPDIGRPAGGEKPAAAATDRKSLRPPLYRPRRHASNPGPDHWLFGVIRVRPSAFSGIRISVVMQVTGADRTQRTRILSPENWKAGG
jgi:hypothetical protein